MEPATDTEVADAHQPAVTPAITPIVATEAELAGVEYDADGLMVVLPSSLMRRYSACR